jgi:hypothetical protein
LLSYLVFNLLRCSALIIEFCPKRVHDLIEAMIGLPRGGRPEFGIAAVLSGVEHDDSVGEGLDVQEGEG